MEIQKLKGQYQVDLDLLTRQRGSLKSELEQASSQLVDQKTENASLKSAISRNSATLIDMESQIKALKAKIDQIEDGVKAKDSTISSLTSSLDSAKDLIRELEQKVQDGERLRRKLHNSVQELKGNIRVFCRVRPLFPSELSKPTAKPSDEPSHISFGKNDDNESELCLVQSTETAAGEPSSKTFPFAFDKVFGPQASQEVVFEEISQLVQSALDGYRVCIFAYGQTGSGKTYTMEGAPDKDPRQAGMIPRAVDQVFSTASSLAEKGWKFTFEASYLEIYNETIRDLLSSGSLDDGSKHEIKHVNGNTTVTDLSAGNI